MESFYLITPVALILIAVAIKLFLWAVNNGQFDDLDREASRILFDDEASSSPSQDKTASNPCPEAQPCTEDQPTSAPPDNRTAQ